MLCCAAKNVVNLFALNAIFSEHLGKLATAASVPPKEKRFGGLL
jgi:hypothetical protein